MKKLFFVFVLSLFVIGCNKDCDVCNSTITGLINQPSLPSNPLPADYSTDNPVNPVLSWACTDSYSSDDLTFDIYLDTINPPNKKFVSNWKLPNYSLDSIDNNKTYYWRINVKNKKGATSVGPIWRFSTGSLIPKNGLVAYYPFNGNSNDESGNGYNCDNYNAVLCEDRFGNTDKAYYFDGYSSYLECNNFQNVIKYLTYSAWIKIEAGGDASYNIGGYGYVSYTFYSAWDIGYHNPSSQFAVYDVVNQTMGSYYSLDNSWHHVVVVYDNSTRSIYIDGNYLSSENITTFTQNYSGLTFRVGKQVSSSQQQNFKGCIDDIRLYDRALSDEDILKLYNEGK